MIGGKDLPLADCARFGSPAIFAKMAPDFGRATRLADGQPRGNGARIKVAKVRGRLEALETRVRTDLFSSIAGTAHILSDDEIDAGVSAFQVERPSDSGETTRVWRQ